MAGRPKTRRIVIAQLAAAQEARAWLTGEREKLAARDDLDDAERGELERALMFEFGDRARRGMSAAKRRARREDR